MKSVFDTADSEEIVSRINNLTPSTKAQWGKMNVGQVLAHLNVTYEYVYDDKHKKPNFLMRFILKSFVKSMVVGDKSYKKNTRTGPDFLMTTEKDFQAEKKRLLDYIERTRELGSNHFDNKESHSFGKLTKGQWNAMFYKHLDHHLSQFGV